MSLKGFRTLILCTENAVSPNKDFCRAKLAISNWCSVCYWTQSYWRNHKVTEHLLSLIMHLCINFRIMNMIKSSKLSRFTFLSTSQGSKFLIAQLHIILRDISALDLSCDHEVTHVSSPKLIYRRGLWFEPFYHNRGFENLSRWMSTLKGTSHHQKKNDKHGQVQSHIHLTRRVNNNSKETNKM